MNQFYRNIVLFALLVAVPFLPTGTLLLRDVQARIDTTRLERHGIGLHGSLYAVLRGTLSAPDATGLETALAGADAAMTSAPRLPLIASAWAELRADIAAERLPPRHTATRLQQLMRDVGDQSALILDPELASYYLVDILVNIIPAALTEISSPSPAGMDSTGRDYTLRNELIRLQGNIHRALERIRTGLGGAASGIDALEQHLQGCNNFVAAAAGEAHRHACATALAALYKGAAHHLERLLDRRLDKLRQERLTTVLIMLFTYSTFVTISVFAWRNYVHKKDVIAARQLIEAQTRLKLAIEGARDGILDWPDVTRDAQYWSPQFKAMLGYAEYDLQAGHQAFLALLHPLDAPAHMAAVRAALESGTPLALECRFLTRSGDYKWLQVKAQASRDEASGTLRIAGSITDIHERKALEQQRQELIKRLERANDELERFAHVASHDLKEPLRTLSGFASLLRHKYAAMVDAEGRDYLNHLTTAAQRMERMITDLLTYAQLNQDVVRLEPCDCMKEAQHVIANLGSTIAEHRACVSVDGTLPLLTTNAPRFSRILQNLIVNSIKYRHPNRVPAIVISAHRKGNAWEFRVTDNGIGIPGAHLETVFEPFKRLHNQQQSEGTGIGLALCKRMVEGLGGRIWVESAEGRGSTFFFTLPAEVG